MRVSLEGFDEISNVGRLSFIDEDFGSLLGFLLDCGEQMIVGIVIIDGDDDGNDLFVLVFFFFI